MYQFSLKFSFLFIPAFDVIKVPKIKYINCTKYFLLNLFEINELNNQCELTVFLNSIEFITNLQTRWKIIELLKRQINQLLYSM